MIQKFLNIIRKTKLKDIAVLSSGVFIAQVIGIAVQPAATRLYTAEMFGKLAIIISLVTMFTPVLTLKYEQFIVIVKTDEESDTLVALSLFVGLLMSGLFTIGIITYNFVIPSTFADAGYWIYTSIPLIFMSAFVQIATAYNNRHEQYKLIASVSVVRSILSNAIKIVLGLLHVGFPGLIISSFIGTSAGIKRQSKYILKNIRSILAVKKETMFQAAKKYKDQPLFSMPGLFVTTYSYSVLPLFITTLYGIKETGLFSQSMMMLGLPLTLISNSAGQVFLRNASKERAETGSFFSSFKNTALLLSLLSFLPFFVLWLFAEPLFAFAFGAAWLRSGTFVRLLVPMYFVRFTVTALMHALIIGRMQKLKLIIQCFFVAEATGTFFVVKYFGLPIETFLTMINYLYLFNYLIIFFTAAHVSRKKVNAESVPATIPAQESEQEQ